MGGHQAVIVCRRDGPGRGLRRLDDRFIAGAAAQIALQCTFDVGVGRFRIGKPKPVQRGDDARRAEAALRTMIVHHRLLHRAERAIGPVEVFDGYHMGGIERADEADAGIDAFIDQHPVFDPPDQNRAGAAIAFRAAFLGSGQPPLEPKPVKQRQVRGKTGEFHGLLVENESNGCAVGLGHVAS